MSEKKNSSGSGGVSELTSLLKDNLIPIEKIQNLVAKSIDTLEEILSNPAISVRDRTRVALEILQLAGVFSQDSLPSSTSEDRSESLSRKNLLDFTNDNLENSQIIDFSVKPTILSSRYLQFDSFLSPEENQKLLEIAIEQRSNFATSSTSTREEDYRKSAILPATFFPDLYFLIRKKIVNSLPSILKKLSHPSFAIGEVEMQMTAHNDGCYYKIHNDSGSPETWTREFTYVYYFSREPLQFSGGELRLYDTDLQDTSLERHDRFQVVEPRNNSIVFFDSRLKHEVMPVICPSKNFEDSRFTVNGWLRRE
jgi:Rps23 Pro-64 3,4-dihydroxylase Tpa1-like proline 4-hydroxylase